MNTKLLTPHSVRFSPAIEVNNNVSSICLPEQDEVFAPGTKCYAMGRGVGSDKPELLYQVFDQYWNLKQLQKLIKMLYDFSPPLSPF